MDPLTRITELRKDIRHHEERYYLHNAPEISDEAFDQLLHELERLETERRESGRIASAAQEEERKRIARELHDEVGQVLTGVMLQLDDADAREAVRQSLDDVRRIARELRPEMLDDLGPSPRRGADVPVPEGGP